MHEIITLSSDSDDSAAVIQKKKKKTVRAFKAHDKELPNPFQRKKTNPRLRGMTVFGDIEAPWSDGQPTLFIPQHEWQNRSSFPFSIFPTTSLENYSGTSGKKTNYDDDDIIELTPSTNTLSNMFQTACTTTSRIETNFQNYQQKPESPIYCDESPEPMKYSNPGSPTYSWQDQKDTSYRNQLSPTYDTKMDQNDTYLPKFENYSNSHSPSNSYREPRNYRDDRNQLSPTYDTKMDPNDIYLPKFENYSNSHSPSSSCREPRNYRDGKSSTEPAIYCKPDSPTYSWQDPEENISKYQSFPKKNHQINLAKFGNYSNSHSPPKKHREPRNHRDDRKSPYSRHSDRDSERRLSGRSRHERRRSRSPRHHDQRRRERYRDDGHRSRNSHRNSHRSPSYNRSETERIRRKTDYLPNRDEALPDGIHFKFRNPSEKDGEHPIIESMVEHVSRCLFLLETRTNCRLEIRPKIDTYCRWIRITGAPEDILNAKEKINEWILEYQEESTNLNYTYMGTAKKGRVLIDIPLYARDAVCGRNGENLRRFERGIGCYDFRHISCSRSPPIELHGKLEKVRSVHKEVMELIRAEAAKKIIWTKITVNVPRTAIGGIMGEKGRNIREIREKTNTQISLLADTHRSDGCRVLELEGESEDVEAACKEIQKHVDASGPCDDDEGVFEMAVKEHLVGRLIGKNGSRLRWIREKSGAKCHVTEDEMGNSKVICSGELVEAEFARFLVKTSIGILDHTLPFEPFGLSNSSKVPSHLRKHTREYYDNHPLIGKTHNNA